MVSTGPTSSPSSLPHLTAASFFLSVSSILGASTRKVDWAGEMACESGSTPQENSEPVGSGNEMVNCARAG